MTLWLTQTVYINIRLGNYFPLWSWIPLQFLLLLGPLLFFYVRSILWPERKFTHKDLLHFSPVLLELALHVLAVVQGAHTGAATYDTPAYKQWRPVLPLLAFVSVAVY